MHSGTLLLAGGGEFKGQMAEADLASLALTKKARPSVGIIPAAAVPDDNHDAAAANGVRWFHTLGVDSVTTIPILDFKSADDEKICKLMLKCDLVYLLGGFPGYLASTLRQSRCSKLMKTRRCCSRVIAGSSAGAMVCCDYYFDPVDGRLHKGLGIVKNVIVVPHFEQYGQQWVDSILEEKNDAVIMGIDEETGAVWNIEEQRWLVFGSGSVTILHDGIENRYRSGKSFR